VDRVSKIFGLSPEKLANLLSIGSELSRQQIQADPEQKKADLLCDLLEEPLPLDDAVVKYLPANLTNICENLSLLSGDTIGSLLQNPNSDISLIKKVKDCSKNLSKSAKSKAEHDTAIAIYYAAIASALIFHGQKTTSFSFEDLNKSFCALIDKPWVPSEIISLYKKASEICQSRLTKKSTSQSRKRTPRGNKK
jgi:hypothetical protein